MVSSHSLFLARFLFAAAAGIASGVHVEQMLRTLGMPPALQNYTAYDAVAMAGARARRTRRAPSSARWRHPPLAARWPLPAGNSSGV
jgi:hypothetical protein